ncbi:hypothetical protein ACMHYB_50320 [Sorangium sp. So ce1128]
MIWLCAGVYAEGPTDDRFLCNLINRILPPLAVETCKGGFYMDDARRIDEPRRMRGASREERIAAAIEESWSECNLFVVHSDGEGTPDEVRRERIEPGLARATRPRLRLAEVGGDPTRATRPGLRSAGTRPGLGDPTRVEVGDPTGVEVGRPDPGWATRPRLRLAGWVGLGRPDPG